MSLKTCVPPDSMAHANGVQPLAFYDSKHLVMDYLKLPLISLMLPGLSKWELSNCSISTSLTNFRSYIVMALCRTVLPIPFW